MCTCPLPARRVNGCIEFLGRSVEGRLVSNRAATLQIPCGQCLECRLKRSRDWAIRCVHEASLHDASCFLTLTYADAPLSLDYSDFQAFLKRLRARVGKLRFFCGGEYGETNPVTGVADGGLYRPHFHCILFGFDAPDKVPLRLVSSWRFFKSKLLDSCWGHGNVVIGDVNFEVAAYIARYCVARVTGEAASAHYRVVDCDGVVHDRVPEFARMSLRPGIGAGWFDRFRSDVFPADRVVARGREMMPPRYYDKRLQQHSEEMLEEVKRLREEHGRVRSGDHTDARNMVRAMVLAARAGLSERS